MRTVTLLLALIALTACTASTLRTPASTRAGACPDNQTRGCLAGTTCAWDSRRNCERCQCAEPAFVPMGR